MPSFFILLHTDLVFQWLLIVYPLLILLDVGSGIGAAIKNRNFNLTLLADFVKNDLLKYATIIISMIGAMLAGIDPMIALDSAKAVIVAAMLSTLHSTLLNIEAITNLPLTILDSIVNGLTRHSPIPLPVELTGETKGNDAPPVTTPPAAPSPPVAA